MEELERFVPTLDGRIAYEHLHRYALAAAIIPGMRVLDVACGEGYGTAALARAAAHVTGVDIDRETIVEARARYGSETAEFVEADASKLPFADETFDAVISFETIEHLADQSAALAEWKRVLKPGGWLIVSSPNEPVYNALRQTPNHFHIGELGRKALLDLLRTHFAHVELLGQRLVTVSMVSASAANPRLSNLAQYEAFTGSTARPGSELAIRAGVSHLAQPEYYIAVCTDAADRPALISDSVFFDAADDLWLKDVGAMRWASDIHDDREGLRQELDGARRREHDHAQEAKRGRAELRAVEARLADQRRKRDEAMGLLDKALDQQQHSLRLAGDLTERLAQSQAALESGVSRRLEEHLTALEPWVRDPVGPSTAPLTLAELVSHLVQARAERRSIVDRLAALDTRVVDLTAQNASAGASLEAEREHARALETELASAANALAASETLASERAEGMRDLEARLIAEAAQQADIQLQQAQLVESERASRVRLDRLMDIAIGTPASRTKSGLTGQRGSDPQIDKAADRMDRLERDRHRRERQLAASHERERELGALLDAMCFRDELGEQFAVATHRVVNALANIALPPHPVTEHPDLEGLFHSVFYAAQPDAADCGDDALAHFRSHGFHQGLNPHPLVDLGWIRLHAREQPDGLDQYLADPAFFALSPHPLFDAQLYLDENPDVVAAGLHPLLHYLGYGWRENRRPNRLFDGYWYLAEYGDVLAAGINPLQHYVEHGRREQRWPHPLFDPCFYLERQTDVSVTGVDPFEHFLLHGLEEGRAPCARLDRLQGKSALLKQALRTDRHARMGIERLAGDAKVVPAEPFWLSQAMRDYLIEEAGEQRINQFVELFRIVDLYERDSDGFLALPAVHALVDHVRESAASESSGISPTASIVIPIYNNLGYTLTCIASILQSEPKTTFEIIIADDHSTDATRDLFSEIGCIRCVTQERNLGFIGNCNAAAAVARGRYLILLNNDTIVLPGWLDQLMEGFEAAGDVGLVGSKLLNGDGTLQEAGGIIWSDSSAWNYGRNQDPRLPQFNYLKDVDYCSGASLAIPTILWRELGGFDETFKPAYCEDSDLAFRVREAGYRTIYQPRSELVHHEGRSHGRDVGSGVKAYQIANQQKLYARWHDVLRREHHSNATNLTLARDRSTGRPHILIVDHYVPQWDRDAGSRTMFAYIRLMVDHGFQITLWPDNLNRDREYSEDLQAMGVEVVYGHAYSGFSSWLQEHGRYFEYVLLSRPHIAIKHLDSLDAFPTIRKLYYGHDLHSMRIRTQMIADTEPLELKADARRWEIMERTICGECDVVLYPSKIEAAHVAAWCKPDAVVRDIPMLIYLPAELDEAGSLAAQADRRDPFRLMFVGGFAHGPNADGLLWFATEVMPLLLAHDPRFHLTIAGSNMPEAVRSLASDAIMPVGQLTDGELSVLYATSGMSIVPLRYGGGVKGKVIEAMAAGIPVAMTSVGGQGIDDVASLAFVGDTADTFAATIVASSEDRAGTRERCVAAVAFLRRHYSETAAIERLAPAIPELVGPRAEAQA